MTAPAAARRQLLARVHIAKKEMRLQDADYRAVLQRMTGQTSSARCEDRQLIGLLDEFRRLGWKPKTGKKPNADPQVRMAYAIWKDIRQMLEGKAGDAELRSFVLRMTGVDAIEFCDQKQRVIVIEGLKGWRANLRKSAKEQAA